MTIDLAHRIAEACRQRASELRSPVSIAIVDAGGHLVLFERMMSPYGWATANISIAKASTAVMFNQPTDAVAQWGSGIPGFASSMATMTQGKFIMAAGGWPIRFGSATIGGLGISGGNAPGRDDEIARAGLAVVEVLAPAVPARGGNATPMEVSRTSSPQLRPSMQPTPVYPSMPMQQAQPEGAFASQNVPQSTRHLVPEQDNTNNDEPAPFDSFQENSGGNS